MVKYIFFILVFGSFVSCGNETEDFMNDFPHLKGRVIKLDGRIEAFNDIAKSNLIIENRKTIVNIVDGTCARCIQELKDWQKFVNTEIRDIDVNLIFVAQGQYDYYFEYNVLKLDYLKLPIYTDVNYRLTGDDLIDVKAEHTVILNESNEIVFIGSPVMDLSIQNVFLKILKR